METLGIALSFLGLLFLVWVIPMAFFSGGSIIPVLLWGLLLGGLGVAITTYSQNRK